MIKTESYFKLNNNSNVLNKDRVVKHHLVYLKEAILETEDLERESQNIKELTLVLDYLTDLETLVDRVNKLIELELVDEDTTIVDECISASNCDSYDQDLIDLVS